MTNLTATRDDGTRSFLVKLTRDQLLDEIDRCEKFAQRLAAERRPDWITRQQVVNNDARLAIAYDILDGA